MKTVSNTFDSICAISSPPGIGGVSLIRISGKDAITIVETIFSKPLQNLKGYQIIYGKILDINEIIDDVLLSIFKNPHSYTGENTVEINCHGSTFIQQEIIELLINKGARLALPGEFSKRAFLNGKLDLSQTEAIADLINSKSSAAHALAIKQLKGGISSELKSLRNKLIEFASLIELELDFSEEDVEFADRKHLTELIQNLISHIGQLKQSFQYGNAIKNGVSTVIAGRPNAGKSTLLNYILNENRAIVSSIAGTTRDTIEEIITINGIDFRIVDTAGIRNTEDEIEKIGVQKTLEKINNSSLVIYIYDIASTSKKEVDQDLIKYVENKVPCLVIANKVDLINNIDDFSKEHFQTSLIDNSDISKIKNLVYELFNKNNVNNESVVISNMRHFEALELAYTELLKIQKGLSSNIPGDLIAMDIRQVLYHIGTITGDISSDELLGNIFANFCIGK
ncbi:MAG: tRNA uridine-5-carboxymethylaminomethyl(34) synthesis GTPase MnmE [Flavobacteriales bacterium]|nr:tRNA uridine-5-carboxymethylaminomethyl(34) synthesis GTPase MnmE [Flavobacteriales bacterium]